jgi:hypothetical protein
MTLVIKMNKTNFNIINQSGFSNLEFEHGLFKVQSIRFVKFDETYIIYYFRELYAELVNRFLSLQGNQRQNAIISEEVFLVQCYAIGRGYYLTTFYDYFKLFGCNIKGLSPSKLKTFNDNVVWNQSILDAVREFLRPRLTPDGLILLPSLDAFLLKEPLPNDTILGAFTKKRLGPIDPVLLTYGIHYYPGLQSAFSYFYDKNITNRGIAKEGISPRLLDVCIVKHDATKAIKPDEYQKVLAEYKKNFKLLTEPKELKKFGRSAKSLLKAKFSDRPTGEYYYFSHRREVNQVLFQAGNCFRPIVLCTPSDLDSFDLTSTYTVDMIQWSYNPHIISYPMDTYSVARHTVKMKISNVTSTTSIANATSTLASDPQTWKFPSALYVIQTEMKKSAASNKKKRGKFSRKKGKKNLTNTIPRDQVSGKPDQPKKE